MANLREDLLNYYERELTYIRQRGAEWAQKYPKLAGRLLLESDRCEDPHVERLIEAFALLAARVHLKLDDDFPEISTALVETLYPHYIRPIPSMSVVEFELDPEQGKLSTGLTIPRESVLNSNRLNNTVCRFRTGYETTLWPIKVVESRFRGSDGIYHPPDCLPTTSALTLNLSCFPDVSFSTLLLSSLRMYLAGESNIVNALYELLCNNCVAITARDLDDKSGKTPETIFNASVFRDSPLVPLGFEEDEGLLPYTGRSFLGYRVLQEYFSFPEKFFFFDLKQLDLLRERSFGSNVQITFLFSRFERPDRFALLETGVSARTIRLSCAPVINLFEKSAEPIQVDGRKFEYPIVPDLRTASSTEVYSVDEVLAQEAGSRQTVRYEPFYSSRHQNGDHDSVGFWYGVRRASDLYDDAPTQIFISIVDTIGKPVELDADALLVRCTCTNHSLPSRMPIGVESGDFQLEGFPAVRRIAALHRPTTSTAPPLRKELMWNLVSQLSLNYLSLVSEGKESLQKILQLYNFSESVYLRNQIQGITAINCKRHRALVSSEDNGAAFARGLLVDLQLDEEQFAGGGVYLFCSVLEHFLGQYVSLNSFTQLRARTRQRKDILREWRPRSGSQILI